MKVLGIETSCDETSAAVVENGTHILSNVTLSQHKSHRPFKGIVPEIAGRAHVESINAVIDQALRAALSPKLSGGGDQALTEGNARKNRVPSIDSIAVTVGPGLVGSLLVGKMTAEALGWAWDLPVVGVNHLEAHLLSPMLNHPRLRPPFLGLVVSGGHTDLILAREFGRYRTLGRTRDDSAGECFDKVANILGLPYPGGPAIDRLAQEGNSSAVPFPRPHLEGSWDFSFSGLKTAVLYYWRKESQKRGKAKAPRRVLADVCASFQGVVVEVLVRKALRAAEKFQVRKIAVGGGVSANRELRTRFLSAARSKGMQVFFPDLDLSTDNAAMIAAAGSFKLRADAKSSRALLVDPSLPIENWSRGSSSPKPTPHNLPSFLPG